MTTRAPFVLVLALACGGASPAPSATSSSPTWHASAPEPANASTVRISATQSWSAAARTILGDACASTGAEGSILVWGDLAVDPSVHPRPIAVAVGDAKPVIEGFIVCGSEVELFLKLQTTNPRFKAGHGGSADLKWRDGQLWLRRRWSAADIALGRLAPPPDGVFQRGEALAAIVSSDDPKVAPADFLAAIARAPRVFVFAMLPLR